MANKVTIEDKLKMNELYLELKSYAAVARATGFSASTVKRYIIDGYQKVETENVVAWEGELPTIGTYKIDKCLSFSEIELSKIEQLRKEIAI